MTRMEKDVKVDAPKHTHRREQITLAPQSPITPLTPDIQLLVAIPAAHLLPVPREEDINIHQPALLTLLVARRLLGHRVRNTNTHSVARRKRIRKVDAAPRVVDVLAPVVAVHSQTAALPAGQAERRVRRRDEPDCDTSICFTQGGAAATNAGDFELEVDGLGALGRERRVPEDRVQRQIGHDGGVAAGYVGAATPVAGFGLGHDVAEIRGRFEKCELAVLNGGVGGRGEVLRRPERVCVGPC
jgi:hypothetical protein